MAWPEGHICPGPVLGDTVSVIHSLTVCGCYHTTAPKQSQVVVTDTLRLMKSKIFSIFPFIGQSCCRRCIVLYDYNK